MFAQIFVATILAVSAQSVLGASCSRSYTIQAGDYCDKISQAQNVSTYQLAVVNANVDSSCSNLIPGQTLCLAENAAEDCSTTYVVRSGDTCNDIASRAGLNTTILSLNNPQINTECTNIYTDEVLCISKTVQVPPVPAAGVSVVASSTTIIVIPSATATPASVAAPATTPTPASTTAAAAATTSAAADDDDDCDSTSSGDAADDDCDDDSTDDGDDEDLPFCDEL